MSHARSISTGTWSASGTWTNDIVSDWWDFNGSTDLLNTPHDVYWVPNEFTVIMQVQTSYSGTQQQHLIRKGNTAYSYGLWDDALNQRLNFRIYDTTWQNTTLQINGFARNTPAFIAIRYKYVTDGTSWQGLSYNGTHNTTTTANGPLVSTSDPFSINAQYYSSSYRYFWHGQTYFFARFDSYLTDEQLDAIYADTATITSYSPSTFIDFSQAVGPTYTPEVGTHTFNVSGSPTKDSFSIPGDGDTVTISSGTTVEIDGDVTIGTAPNDISTYVVTIDDNATLKWLDNPTGDWTFTVKGNVNVRYGSPGGAFQVGSSLSPIPAERTATVHFPADLSTADYWRIYNGGGTVKSCGASAYHMASTTSQRTQISAGVSAGAGVTITLSTPVDWEVGDTIWIGTGGAQFGTPTECEQATILSKLSASAYTANLTYDHVSGDIVVQADRNVIFSGGSAARTMRIVNVEADTGGVTYIPTCDIRWAKFENVGDSYNEAAIVYQISASEEPEKEIPTGSLHIDSIVLDQHSGGAGGIYLDTNLNFEDSTNVLIDNFHIYNGNRGIYVDVYGDCVMGDITGVGLHGILVYSFLGKIQVDSIWASGRTDRFSDTYGSYGFLKRLDEGKFFNVNAGVYCGTSSVNNNQMNTEEGYLQNCDFFYSNSYAFSMSKSISPKYVLENCRFSQATHSLVYLDNVGTCVFKDCTFDDGEKDHGGFSHIRTEGGVNINMLFGTIKFEDCDFGMSSRNWERNIALGYGTGGGGQATPKGRLIIENCRFMQPDSYQSGDLAPTPDYENRGYVYCSIPMYWVAYVGTSARWTNRDGWPEQVSIEYVNVNAYRYSNDVDYWAAEYGDTRVSLLGGGGETRTPSMQTVDGTYSMEFRPFNVRSRAVSTENAPVKIPAQEGQTITVTLDVKYDSGDSAYSSDEGGNDNFPGIHLRGLGIIDDAHMSSMSSSWTRLTVTGTAAYTGVVEFYATSGTARHPRLTNERYFEKYIPTGAYKWSVSFTDWGNNSPPPRRELTAGGTIPVREYNTDAIFPIIVYADRLRIVVV